MADAGRLCKFLLVLVVLLFIIPLLVTSGITFGFCAKHSEVLDQFPDLSVYDVNFTHGMAFAIWFFWIVQQTLFNYTGLWRKGTDPETRAPILRRHAWAIFAPLPIVFGSLTVAMLIRVFASHYRSNVHIVGTPLTPGSYIMNFTLQTHGKPDIERYFCGLQDMPHNYTLYFGQVLGTNSQIHLNGTELHRLQKKCAVVVATRWMILPYMVSMFGTIAFYVMIMRGLFKLQKLQEAERQHQHAQAQRAVNDDWCIDAQVQRPNAVYWWDNTDHRPTASSVPEVWELKGWGFQSINWPQQRADNPRAV